MATLRLGSGLIFPEGKSKSRNRRAVPAWSAFSLAELEVQCFAMRRNDLYEKSPVQRPEEPVADCGADFLLRFFENRRNPFNRHARGYFAGIPPPYFAFRRIHPPRKGSGPASERTEAILKHVPNARAKFLVLFSLLRVLSHFFPPPVPSLSESQFCFPPGKDVLSQYILLRAGKVKTAPDVSTPEARS